MTQILYKQKSSIQKGETVRGMNFVSPLVEYKFYNQNSEQIYKKYFPDADNLQQANSNLILDAIDETKNGYDFKRYDFFSDKNRDSKINPNEELIFKLLLFVSTDGNKVKECYEVVKPADDEIIFFLETDSDSLSEQKLFGRVSEKIRKTYVNTSTGKLYSSFFDGNIIDTVQKYLSKANKPIIEELFINGYITDKSIAAGFFSGLRYLLIALSAPSKALGWVVNKLGEEFDSLKIPDEFWDTENENYSFNKENIIENLSISTDKLAILKNLFTDKKGFNLADITLKMLDDIILNQLAVIESFVGKYNSYVKTEIEDIFKILELPEMEMATDSIAQPIALICGVWNGLVDFVSSIFKFIGMLLEAPFDISKDFQQILEMIDNFWDGLRDGSVWKNLKNAVDAGMKDMVEYLKGKDANDINWVRIYYISGFTISFIGTFFIPVAHVAKIGELGKVGEILVKINEEVGKTISQTAKFVKVQTAEAYHTVSKAFIELFELIKVGGQKLKNFVNDIWKKIADWFLKNRKTANAVDWMSSKLFKFGDDDRTFRNFLKLRQRATDEFYNVLCHGEPDRIIINGRKLKAEEFAKMLLEQGYEKGKPIRLISCHTGVKQNGFASKLAKLLETKVIAPTDRISLNDLGEFIIDKKGKFVEFNK
ncbi:hypothetical protein [Epilithonimonas hungarica]|uniref:Uncharacterized protein n=1 Tax=Epilithonimonas hungarica TaxID=454006 RepID=A0A1G7PHW2_9FLAO|nr:hypothetical protein [Epilithonimonas hungarica]SDF85808.1 hypothetical protein SAMN05421825_2300 [Epilithonimonas hungarica]